MLRRHPVADRGAKKTNEPTIPLIFQRRASREREQAPPLSVRLRAGCRRRPVARCAAGGRSSNITISVRPERPSSIVAPTRFTNLDGAAVDLTIVRPAAAAPPRRLEQVGPIAGRSDRGSLG